MNNIYVRMMIAESGLDCKKIAKHLCIRPGWFSRLLKNEMTDENKLRVLCAINELCPGIIAKKDGEIHKKLVDVVNCDVGRYVDAVDAQCKINRIIREGGEKK